MLAPKRLTKAQRLWNQRYHSPYGRQALKPVKRFLPENIFLWLSGPFSKQTNNNTRLFEYPWAFTAIPIVSGMKVLEIGGGLSGFQFTLDNQGCSVINVDPGLDAKGVGWPCDQESMRKLNRLFGTRVKLLSTTIDQADLVSDSFDRIFSISAIEHFTPDESIHAMQTAYRLLKPGGFFVLTVDLFLNLIPFTARETNEFGRNMNVKDLVEAAPYKIHTGKPNELFGYPEFDTHEIMMNLEKYFLGSGYPTLIQCVVLEK
jgi:SAM-dependent methyltransferase